MNRWLKEPLVHFVVLGALIFAWYAWTAPDRPGDDEIVVSRGQQDHLATAFSRTWQRPPTPTEFTALVNDWIREELAYREGQSMGLDANDTIIRRRLRQKLELLAEDIVAMDEPTEVALRDWLRAHPGNYRAEPRVTFRQIYFSRDRRGDAASSDAEDGLALLDAGGPGVDPTQIGDPLPLPARMESERLGAVASQFGAGFAAELETLETGRWLGPVESGYGLHLVYVEARTPGRELTLDEARRDVRRDLENARRQQAIDRLYERLREQYTITIEPFDESRPAP